MKKTIKLLCLALTITLMMGLMACGEGEDIKDTSVGSNSDSVINSEGESESEIEKGPELTDYFQIAINGKVYSVPSRVDEFFADSSVFNTNKDISGSRGEYWNKLEMNDVEKDLCFGTAYTSHESSDSHVIGEEYVYWLELEAYTAKVSGISITLYGGITLDSTYEEIVAIFGEPAGSGGNDQSMAYRWEKFCPNTEEGCTSELSIYFEEGKIDKIYLKHQIPGLN